MLVPARFFIYALTCIGTTIIGAVYASMNFAWVCMVNTTVVNNSTSSGNPYGGEFEWGTDAEENVLSAYSIGGLIVALPAGWIADRFGSRTSFALASLLSGVATLLIPAVAPLSWEWVMVLRIIVGLGGSFYWPIVFNVCACWSPKKEFGLSMAVASSGFQAGQFICILLSGLQCEHIGWESLFYLSGGSSTLFALLWYLVYRGDPTEFRFMSENEKSEIVANRRGKKPAAVQTPWVSILLSLPVWSCNIARFCTVYISYAINTFTPTYLRDTLNVNVDGNGFLSSLPLLMQLIGRWICGPLSDVNIVSPTVTIKLYTAVAMLGSAACSLGLGFVQPGIASAYPIVLLCGIMFLISLITGGFQKAPLLMAPQHSAFIGSLLNVFGNAGSICMPYVIATITEGGTEAEWHTVFYTVAAAGAVGTIAFSLFGSGKMQPWASKTQKDTLDEDKSVTKF